MLPNRRDWLSHLVSWQLITGEYPPQPGGVSDYSQQVAAGLAEAGDDVQVWAPSAEKMDSKDRGVSVHGLIDRFGPRSLARMSRDLNSEGRLLVQYLPHAFGAKAANLAFCIWLFSQRNKMPIDVMFHEVAMPFKRDQPWRHKVLAVTNHFMAILVARAAHRIFVAIPAWSQMLKPILPATASPVWLPVPSNISVDTQDREAADPKQSYVTDGVPLFGHFGTYTPTVADLLIEVLPKLLIAFNNSRLLLLGRNAEVFRNRIGDIQPELKNRVDAPGSLKASTLSRLLSRCDVMVQPYPDGITSRHTSAMAALAHGRPVVTTSGRLTEAVWRDSGAVALSTVSDLGGLTDSAATLIVDECQRERVARAGKKLYDEKFDLRHTITALRAAGLTQNVAQA